MERWTKDVLTKIVNYYAAGETFKVGAGKYTTSVPCVYVKYLRETKRSKIGFEAVMEYRAGRCEFDKLSALLSLDIVEATKQAAIMDGVEVKIYGGEVGRK